MINALNSGMQVIRSASEQAAAKSTPAEAIQSFGEHLKQAIDGVAAQEENVRVTTDKFILGEADVTELMIVSQQAHLSLQLTAQVRTKVIEAYQEIMRMQV